MEQITNLKYYRDINLEVLKSKQFMAWTGLDKYVAQDREWFLHDSRVRDLIRSVTNLAVVDTTNYWQYEADTRTLKVIFQPNKDIPAIDGFQMELTHTDKLAPGEGSPWQDGSGVEGELFNRNSSWFVNKLTGQLIVVSDHGEVGFSGDGSCRMDPKCKVGQLWGNCDLGGIFDERRITRLDDIRVFYQDGNGVSSWMHRPQFRYKYQYLSE